MTYDYLVVGAGFAGATIAERLASQCEARVLIVDARPHVAGNAYDPLDEHGIRIHRYGPHIFHTSSRQVVDYLSLFTKWLPYEHRVLASVQGQLLPIPICAQTIEALCGRPMESIEVEAYLETRRISFPRITNSEEAILSRVGRELYELFFASYTRKQWGIEAHQLDASVCGRIPVRTSRDDRYFTDEFQAMPRDGYEALVAKMLAHPNIEVVLGTTFAQAADRAHFNKLVYTGPIDEYFGKCFGPLPYRSLEFVFETIEVERAQAAAVVNYPGDEPYTRITEFKQLTGQQNPKTTIAREYPCAIGDPYYPIPRPENRELARSYAAKASTEPNVVFVGRLAEYRYYNIDQVVASALVTFQELAAEHVE